MITRVPDHYEQFRCLAGDCPHTCCTRWEVVIDEDSADRYRTVPGPLGEQLRAALTRDADGDWCFPLEGERCPFLNGENLCDIHCQLGEAATSVTCREHPRFTEDYGPFREITLSASCPAANALLLGSEAPLTFRESGGAEPVEEELELLLAAREYLMKLLTDRTKPMRQRLGETVAAAAEIQTALDCWDEDWLAGLPHRPAPTAVPVPEDLSLLRDLEVLELDWPGVLAAAEQAEPVGLPEPLLERIAVYFAFRYLLKAINDGDLLSRALLCVYGVATVARVAAVTGLGEALRRFSAEVEHSDENLELLLERLAERT